MLEMEIDLENGDNDPSYNYPNYLYINGFSFLQQGWNGILEKSYQYSLNGAPIYYLKSYYLYGLLPIKPLKLIKQDKTWILCVCDNDLDDIATIAIYDEKHFCKSKSDILNTKPVGEYRGLNQSKITICEKKHYWF